MGTAGRGARETGPRVRLDPMTSAEFGPYVDRLITNYAASHVRNGRWTAEEGPREARAEVERLLPARERTPGQFLFTARATGAPDPVGILWVAIEPGRAFVYDLEVEPAHRQHGYGRELMLLAETVARDHGARRIALHVFGDNAVARRLYSQLGYRETNVSMSKDLGP